MARWVRSSVFVIVVALAAPGCGPGKPAPGAPPPPTVTVIRAGTAPVQNYSEYNGYLDAVESVMIQARVEGFLKEVLFREGEEVAKDDRLYVIDPREYAAAVAKSQADIAKAAADIENAKAQILLAEAELNRLKKIGVDGASKSELDKADAVLAANKAQLDVSKANKAAAEAALDAAKLKLDFTDIHAPIAGRISSTRVTPGNLVGQKEPTMLTSIMSVDPMYVKFDVPERALVAYLKVLAEKSPTVTPEEIKVEMGLATEEGYPHVGVIDFRDNRVETGTGTVRIRGRVPNPMVEPQHVRMLYPGLYCRVRVPIGPVQPRLVIPEDALMTGQEGRYVYVLSPENIVQKRSVTVGRQVWRAGKDAGSWTLNNPKPADGTAATATVRSVVAIESGLAPEDRIIAVGTQMHKARPGAPVTPEMWDFRGQAGL
jgi:RND family efflux transporter MFP subunit